MLVFSPPSLPDIFQSLVTNFQPSLRNSEPAYALYMLARFACLTCDHIWLEDLIIGATDAIEDTFFVSPFPSLFVVMLVDDDTSEPRRRPDVLDLLVVQHHRVAPPDAVRQLYQRDVRAPRLLRPHRRGYQLCLWCVSSSRPPTHAAPADDAIRPLTVFIIRYVERRIDHLIDTAILDHSPLPAEFEGIQFESDWSFLRSFAPKKKTNATPTLPPPRTPGSPNAPSRPPSPLPTPHPGSPSNSMSFSSLRQSFTRTRAGSVATPLQAAFQQDSPHPGDITSFFDALQTLLTLSGINPALITQMWSQVFYWIACKLLPRCCSRPLTRLPPFVGEIFNRVITRKKYVCR